MVIMMEKSRRFNKISEVTNLSIFQVVQLNEDKK